MNLICQDVSDLIRSLIVLIRSLCGVDFGLYFLLIQYVISKKYFGTLIAFYFSRFEDSDLDISITLIQIPEGERNGSL